MKILIVEDDPVQNDILKGFLGNQGFQVISALNGKDALKHFQELPVQLVLLDMRIPDMAGDRILSEMIKINPLVRPLVITAYGTIKTAVDVMKKGAVDFIEKPVNLTELLDKIKAIEKEVAVQEDAGLVSEQIKNMAIPLTIIGNGPQMKHIFSLIRRVAPTPWNVLINGETGTGKELMARLIHDMSPRKEGPFVDVNCAAVPENLFESELFGHEKGAFTGATERRHGYFERADKGTLFLDEIGELPLKMQAKLLRILQTKSSRRVGGEKQYSCDVRVVSATNKDIKSMIRSGEFREDLYYRLNVLDMELYPLRARKEDLPDLIGHFLDRYTKGGKRFSEDALATMMKYDYPGNVRELKHMIQRTVTLSRGAVIELDDLPVEIRHYQKDQSGTLAERLETMERQLLLAALEQSQGVKTKAADALGISERVLRYKISKYAIYPLGSVTDSG